MSAERKAIETMVRSAVEADGVPLPAIWKQSVVDLCVRVIVKFALTPAQSPVQALPLTDARAMLMDLLGYFEARETVSDEPNEEALYASAIRDTLKETPVRGPLPAGEWRDIETAPKDGTMIDVCTAPIGRTTDVKFRKGQWQHWWRDEFESFGWVPLSYPPTHWMPLPQVPGITNPAEEGEAG
jgi:hypothetical protein